jgi:hypothetical protein
MLTIVVDLVVIVTDLHDSHLHLCTVRSPSDCSVFVLAVQIEFVTVVEHQCLGSVCAVPFDDTDDRIHVCSSDLGCCDLRFLNFIEWKFRNE